MTTLRMLKLQRTDCGDYKVVLENAYGKDSFSIKLTVIGE